MAESINLYASSIYGAAQGRHITPSAESLKETSNFHDLVNVNFNSYSKLTPSQILDKISIARVSGSGEGAAVKLDVSNHLLGELTNLRETLTKQETQARKAALGKANLTELMAETVKAETAISTLVALRDEIKGAFDKIWGMNL